MRILCLLFSYFILMSVSAQQQIGATLVGRSAAISGNGQRIITGDPFADSDPNNNFNDGIAQVFELVGDDWIQMGPSFTGFGFLPQTGYAVDITADGNRIAICEAYDDSPQGNVRVYDWMNGAWTQVGGDILNIAFGTFASNVKMTPDGNRLIVNGKYSNTNAFVTVHELVNGNWVQLGSTVEAPLLEYFRGRYGDIDINGAGDRIVLTNPSRIDFTGPFANLTKGFIYVYDLVNGDWQLTSTIESDISNTGFGWSIGLAPDGNRLVVGEPKGHSEVCSTNFRPGNVDVYDWNGVDWIKTAELTGIGCEEDNVGRGVSISDDGLTVGIGAVGRDDQPNSAGKVFVYKDKNGSGQWAMFGTERRGELYNEQLGNIAKISGDGEYLLAANFLNPGSSNYSLGGKIKVFKEFFTFQIFEGAAACIELDNGSLRIISKGLSSSCPYNYSLVYQDGSIITSGPFLEDNFNIGNLAEGNYTFIIYDENGLAVDEYSVEVAGIVGIVFEMLEVTTTNSVNDLPVGKISITLAGGMPGFNISWSGPATGSITSTANSFEIPNLIGGTYFISVIDFLGNSVVKEISIINETAPVETCDSPLDIIILNDVSGSVDAVEYEESKTFFVNFCNALNLGAGVEDSRVAIAEFSDTENQEIRIPITGSLGILQAYTGSLRNFEGGTNPNAALTYGYNYLEANARPNATKILVLSTDAQGNQVSPALVALSKEYQAQGYIVVTIAFDEAFNNPYTLSILQETATATSLAPGADAYSNLTESLAEYIVNVYVCGYNSGASNTFNFSRDGIIEIINYTINGDCNDFESIELEINISAVQQLALPAGTPISFYFNNPEIFSATPILTSFLPCALEPGDSETITVTIPISGPSEIWAVLNDDISQQPPISFPTTDIDESIYINNLDFVTVCVDEVPTVSVLKYTTTPIPVCGNTVFYTVDICNISQYDLVEVFAQDRAPFNFQLRNLSINNNGCALGENPFDIPVGCCVSLTYEYDASNAAFGLYNNQGFDLYGPGNQVYINYNGLSSTNEDVLIGEVDCPSEIVEMVLDPRYTVVCDDQFNLCKFEITNTTNVPLQSVLFQATIPEPVIWASEPYSISSMSISNSSIAESNTANFIIDEIPPFTTGTFSIAMYIDDWEESGSFEVAATLSQLPEFVNGNGNDISVLSSTIFVNAGPTINTNLEVNVIQGDTAYLEATLVNGQNAFWLSAGDGTFDDPNSLTPIYVPGPQDLIDGVVSISLEVENTDADCNDDLAAITLNIIPCPNNVSSLDIVRYCEGETVSIFGQEVTEAGLYESTFDAYNGCDSLAQIELILNPTYLNENTLEFCDGETAFVLGQEITSNETVFGNYTSQFGCDSVEQINVVFIESINTSEVLEFCNGAVPIVFGVPQSDAGTYAATFAAQNGCDSIHQITLIENFSVETSEILTICEGESISIFGSEESSEGIYTGQFMAANSCDSTHQVELLINKNVETFETMTICEGESVNIFGNIENESGLYENTFTAFNSCDSTHRVTLTVNTLLNTFEDIVLCEGETATVFGNTETETGVFLESFIASNGCDSMHQINLTINEILETNETINICEGESTFIFGNEESEAGTYEVQDISMTGCDSIHKVILEVNQLIETTQLITICAGESIDIFGTDETETGIYSAQFTGINNCDSTHQIELIVYENIITSETMSICEGEELEIFGNMESEAGVYENTFTSFTNCDSTHTINLISLQNQNIIENLVLCEREVANIFGNFETEAGLYTENFTSSNGCDSVHQINLSFNEIIETNELINICEGESTLIFGNEETEAGTYETQAISMSGCDSIHHVTLEVNQLLETSQIISICEGESAEIFGVNETEAGIYSAQFTSSNNCDSTHQIELIVYENIVTIDTISICEGEELEIFGSVETEAGLYESNFTSFNNCDSTHQVNLIVFPTINTNETIEVCEGEMAFVFGNEVAENDILEATFSSLTGCDSVHTVSVVFVEEVEIIYTEILCADEMTTFFGEIITNSGIYYHSTSSLDEACDTTYVLEVEVLEPIEFTLPESIEVLEDTPFTIPLFTTTENITFEWSSPEYLDCANCEVPMATLSESQVFTVQLSNELGCIKTAQIIVNVQENLDIFYPNVFSPNNDGTNDYFNIFTNDEGLTIKQIQIFDRWGSMVYQSTDLIPNDYNNGWDGTFRGKPMDEGIYVYQIALESADGENIFKSGDLLLMR